MNSSLSFRKESIQRSSSMSESLNHAQEAQGPRVACEQRPISITAIFTATM
jgi:hypothetical protein